MKAFVRTALAAVAVVATLSACTTTSGGTDPEGAGSIVVSGTYPIESIDPHSAEGGASGKDLIGQEIFSRLTRPDPQGKIIGDLATDWSADAATTSWTFTLRSGVNFSDGSALTADDVVASFRRLLGGDSPAASNFTGASIESSRPDQVVIKTAKPDAALPSKLVTFFILPKTVAQKDAGFFKAPVGSGPFTVKSFTPGETIVLAANDKYWGGKPKLETVTIRSIPEIAARLTALRTGEVDLVWGVPNDQLADLKADSNLKTEAVATNQVYTMWFNSSVPALKTAAIRNALWKAVDFNTIIKSLYPETGALADAPVAPTVFGYSPQQPKTYDPAAAKAELTAAGFDFGKPLRLQFANPEFRPFNQAVVSDLSKIGVKIDLLEKEQAVFIKDLIALDWDVNFQMLGTAGFDAASNLGRLYTCAAKRNGYCNPQLDELLATAGSTSDEGERKTAYAAASKIIWDDAVGMYPMTVQTAYVWNKRLQGFTLDAGGYPDFAKARVNRS
ncbi:ABC transporter substrate-binding protein [Plantactinospora mayteni]|uniref:ABC transporter substrate-binding protein n=1 Tax=Plantactinospora mayteni TaxID=566021 RepID=A0ABQ4F186_9ACTN|nr:ABC transporter substrate-binding protein [Plantactinospora mayteni]GIH00686.1 ABC transporter substrate-binding protein [Plantactinospora mayteni]